MASPLSVVPAQYFRRLQGRKHLIRGNHDTGLENAQALFEYCESVVDYWELDDGEEHIILCHYPMIYEKRGYMIHGHLHAHRGRAYTMLQQLPQVLNCGVDVNFLRPVHRQGRRVLRNIRSRLHEPDDGDRHRVYGQLPYRLYHL